MAFDINQIKEIQENNKNKKLNEEAEKTQNIRKYVNSVINDIKDYFDSEIFEDDLQSHLNYILNTTDTDELYIEIYTSINYTDRYYEIHIRGIYNSQFYIGWAADANTPYILIPRQYIKEIFSTYWDMVVEKLKSLNLQAKRPKPDLNIPNDWFCYRIALSIIEK